MLDNDQLVSYFERGYITTQLPDHLMSRLWAEIYMTEWVADTDNVYKAKPNWYTTKKYDIEEDGELQHLVEKTYGSALYDNVPTTVKDVAVEIINLPKFDFLRSFKDTATLKYVHLWNGAEAIPWHFDTIDGSDTLVFVYLTDTLNWQSSYGGSISFCKDINGVLAHEATLLPNNGTMVIVNNSNPLFKHKVEELKDWSHNRYLFSFCFKWN